MNLYIKQSRDLRFLKVGRLLKMICEEDEMLVPSMFSVLPLTNLKVLSLIEYVVGKYFCRSSVLSFDLIAQHSIYHKRAREREGERATETERESGLFGEMFSIECQSLYTV